MAAVKVFGLKACIQGATRLKIIPYGKRGNLEKSGVRFST